MTGFQILKSNSVLLAPDTDWLLLPVSTVLNNPDYTELIKNNSHVLYTKSKILKPIQINNAEDLHNIVIGNIIPRMTEKSEKELKIKGNFIIIRISKDEISLLNDHLGIQKFFFTDKKGFLASNDLENIIIYRGDNEPDKVSQMLYLLFNYFVWGRTAFKDILYSEPSTLISIKKGVVAKSVYYKLSAKHDRVYSFSEKSDKIAEFWKGLIGDYVSKDSSDVSLTLTGGYDSRMILAGLLNSDVKISAFTFGNPESQDVINAKKIAKKINLHFLILPLGREVTGNLPKLSEQLVSTSGGMLNLLRILRLYYFREASELKELYLGYAGSEIIRGSYPDGLLTSRFLLEHFKGNRQLNDLIIEHLNKYRFNYNVNDLDDLINLLNAKLRNYKPLDHLFEVVIPLHFGEDIRWLEMSGIKCRTPYLDIDFIEFLTRIDGLSLLRPSEMKIKDSNLSRIDNPKISASVISKLSKDLASYPLGKGYSPKDYLISKYFAGVKLVIKKYLIRKEMVTVYQPWYPEMLNRILSDKEIIVDGFDKLKLQEDLLQGKRLSEVDFLPYTKFYNLYLINKLFNDKAIRQ